MSCSCDTGRARDEERCPIHGGQAQEIPKPPADFESWEDCRDYWALESIFRGQWADRHPSKRNKERYMKAAKLAVAANNRCANPLPMEDE
jgi:hypothetical protein